MRISYQQRAKVVFVIAGNPDIGMGHVYRALCIAEKLKDYCIQFVCLQDSFPAEKFLFQQGYSVVKQNKDENLFDLVIKQSPNLVINDFLDTTSEYILNIKSKGIKIINFEDKGSGALYADAVINALFDSVEGKNVYAGHEYFELRDEFIQAKKIKIQDVAKKILITFGGADKNNITLEVISTLKELAIRNKIKLLVISGPAYSHTLKTGKQIEMINNEHGELVTYISNGTNQISKYMLEADIAISSCGRTPYELTHLGIPTIVIATNERETSHKFPLQAGLIYLGEYNTKVKEEILKSVNYLMGYRSRLEMRNRIDKINLAQGKEKVMNIILSCLATDK